MNLFSQAQRDKIDEVARKSTLLQDSKSSSKSSKSVTSRLSEIADLVVDYFKDSPAILITTPQELHDYVDKLIDSGYAGIDTETTGLDRVHDHVVGASLYYPGGVECYIPIKHLVPIFDQPYKNQLTYQQVQVEFQRIADAGVKLILANADFDLAMIFKDIGVDLCDNAYYDVILAWRCIKEDERENALKVLYNKYVLKGKGDPKKFSDFFTPDIFPYCRPEIAKLYAAHDAKITFVLFKWQLPYVTASNSKCKKHGLEQIASLIWNVEMPLMKVCQKMHRNGIYLDVQTARSIGTKYNAKYQEELNKLHNMVQEIIDANITRHSRSAPFRTGKDFNPSSIPQVKYLLKDLMRLPQFQVEGVSTGKDVITDINLPVTNQILLVRSYKTLIGTFVDKLPKATTPDSRIHANFKQVGADTGRMSSESPNMQNIPSHATDIRHMFRATPEKNLILDCQASDNVIQVTLPRYYYVQTDSGEVEVCHLSPGYVVSMIHDDTATCATLQSVEEADDTSMMTLTLIPKEVDNEQVQMAVAL